MSEHDPRMAAAIRYLARHVRDHEGHETFAAAEFDGVVIVAAKAGTASRLREWVSVRGGKPQVVTARRKAKA